MIILSKEQIIALHAQLISETGGTDGLRDERLLDSALAAPFQSFDNEDVFPSIEEKAARLGYGLVCNHAFIDGNKRIGAHVMLVFLALNKIKLDYTQDELLMINFWNGLLIMRCEDALYQLRVARRTQKAVRECLLPTI